jgi:acetylglutamate kinase
MKEKSVKPVEAPLSDCEIQQVDSNLVGDMSHIDDAALYRRIDRGIIPLIFLCYLYAGHCCSSCDITV